MVDGADATTKAWSNDAADDAIAANTTTSNDVAAATAATAATAPAAYELGGLSTIF